MLYLLAGLFVVALAVTQAFYGGAMRPVFALPGYAIIGAIGLLGFSALWRRNASTPALGRVLSVLLFAGWLIWRTTNSPDVWMAANYLRLILACLVTYLIFAFVLTNPIHRLAFIVGLMGLAFFQVVLEVWQFTHVHDSFPLPWFSEQLKLWYGPRFGSRSHGFYLNGNHLAWFLNAVGIFALSATCWGRWSITTKIVTLYVSLVCFAGSVLSASRGGAVGLAAGLTVFVLLSGVVILIGSRNKRRVALLVLASGMVGAMAVVAIVINGSYIVQVRFSELLDEYYRPSLLAVAARQFQLDPLYGGGAGSFSVYACRFRTMNNASDDIYAHNDWAQLLADFGLPAGLLLLVVVLVHANGGIRSLLTVINERMTSSSRPQSHAAMTLIAALSSLAVFVVESGFDFNMQIPVNAVLAAACLGLVANAGVTAGTLAPKTSARVRFAGCLLAALGGGWLIFMVVEAAEPEFSWLRAENAFLEGDLKLASKFVNESLSKTVIHPPFRRLAGLVLLENNRTSDSPWERLDNSQNAVQAFAQALVDSPYDWKNSFLLGTALKKMGRLGLAEKPAIDSILLNPSQSSGYELYADCLVQEGRLDEAMGAYLRASQLPGETHARQSITELERQLSAAAHPELPK